MARRPPKKPKSVKPKKTAAKPPKIELPSPPRRVDFWSEAAAESIRKHAALEDTCAWWRVVDDAGLRECLDGTVQKLRQGGWGEDDIREMTMMTKMDGPDESYKSQTFLAGELLLCEGGSREDTVHALDLGQEDESNGSGYGTVIKSSGSEPPNTNPTASCSIEEDHQKGVSEKPLMHFFSLRLN